jgi:hypothetical protein
VALYACEVVEVDGTCSAWASVNPYLLPPLSLADGAELAGLIVGAWVVAVCGRYLVDRLLNRR